MLRFSAEGFRDWEGDGCGAWGGEEERTGAARDTARRRKRGGGESAEEAGVGRGMGGLEWRWMHRWVHWALWECDDVM
jgi:hypothetical protein